MRDTHIGCMRSLPCWAVLLQITGVELALFACLKRFSEGSAGEGGLCAAPLCVHGKLAVVLEATTPLRPEQGPTLRALTPCPASLSTTGWFLGAH